MKKVQSWLVFIGIGVILAGFTWAITLDSIPNESKFGPQVKGILGTWETAIESAGALASDETVTGDWSFGGNLTVSDDYFKMTPTAISVTNGQILTITDSRIILTGTGQANNYTNTITLLKPATAQLYSRVLVSVAGASTNLIAIADGSAASLTTAWEGDAYDSLELEALSTSYWVELGRNDI